MTEFTAIDVTAFVRHQLSNLSADLSTESGDVVEVEFDAFSDGESHEVALRVSTREGSQWFRLTLGPMTQEEAQG